MGKQEKNQKPSSAAYGRPKSENGWIKFLRVIIYAISIVGTAIGTGLIKAAALSSTYADGTHDAKLANGLAIFIPSIIFLSLNAYWGMIRWFLRGYRESWRPGRIIGKLIGGGLWRTLVIAPLFLVTLLALTPVVEKQITANLSTPDLAQAELMASSEHRLEYLNEHFDELDPEEVYEELREYTLANIDFGTDEEAEENNVTSKASGLFTENAYARTSHVILLNKAKLSSGGRFIVIYTDRGDDKISDAQAEQLGEMLEDIVASYKNNLGLDYVYEMKGAGATKQLSLTRMLAANGFDRDIMMTAMPVYVADCFRGDSAVLASYASPEFLEIITQIAIKLAETPVLNKLIGFDNDTVDMLRFYDSAPSFPFINMGIESVRDDDLKSVAAHEMGHHYNYMYKVANFNGFGDGESFIKETIANWMAVNVVTGQRKGTINGGHYNSIYLYDGGHASKPTETLPGCSPGYEGACQGYPLLAMLENYYQIVPDAQKIMLDATYYGDALSYLYDQAGAENFAKVMTSLAERNLTGDYGGKLINYTLPKGEEFSCGDVCSHTFNINPAATGYLYFTPDEYDGALIEFKGYAGVTASLVGKNLAGKWVVLDSGETTLEFEFNDAAKENYEVIALAVSNPSIADGARHYLVKVTNVELEELVEDEEFDFDMPEGEAFSYLGNGCYQVYLDELFGYFTEFVNLGSEFLGALSQFDESGQIGEVKTEYDADAAEAKAGINAAKSELEAYNISVCGNYLANGHSFETVKARLQSALGQNINVYDDKDGDSRISAFVGFDAFARRARAYVLAADSGEMGLITINIEPK